jgi:hypothetical protein
VRVERGGVQEGRRVAVLGVQEAVRYDFFFPAQALALVAHTPRPARSGGGPEAARARRTHTHRYFVIEKVKAEGGPDKFYATRLLKYYADKEAYANDPNSFKGCIQCSIKTPVQVEVGFVLSVSELAGAP